MRNNLVQINHDPFGRFCIMREIIEKDFRNECDICYREARFVYYAWDDGIYTSPRRIKGEFCSINCMRIYNQ